MSNFFRSPGAPGPPGGTPSSPFGDDYVSVVPGGTPALPTQAASPQASASRPYLSPQGSNAGSDGASPSRFFRRASRGSGARARVPPRVPTGDSSARVL